MEMPVGKFFLLEPYEKKYKKIIVYSDDPEAARYAAKQKYHPQKVGLNEINFSDEKLVYLNPCFSYCKEIEPKIISIDDKLKIITIKYAGVIYKIMKNKPIEYIGGGWF